ncbi:MAG: alanine--glyoxylate aminotransferase family protein [Planctomycetes bacterium]|nr:alanine--glyoxylate aminotransferase family protein [Planctomycetota bacterium]
MNSEIFSPPQRILMGPGPSCVHPRVYRALSAPIVGHLDPAFLAIMDRLQAMLRSVFQTRNRLTLCLSGTGSAGMEAALANVIEPGDTALIGVNGVFGTRLADIVERVGGRLARLERPWGEVFSLEEVKAALDRDPSIKVVALVHAETSTGAHQPLAEIGKLCREREKLLVADAVTSLGGAEFKFDDWLFDVCYSGKQMCLCGQPGLAPITFSDRAVEKLRARKRKPPSWYLDLNLIDSYWTESERAYHHTAPISMNYALHEALALVLEEGLEKRFERHRLNSRALVSGLEALGFRMFAQEGRRLPMLNAVWIPGGIADAAVRQRLLQEYNLEIGGGLAAFAGKIWRIGLMGESSRRENVIFFLSALEGILWDVGAIRSIGAGVEAAASVYSGKSGSGSSAGSGGTVVSR